MAFLPFSLDRKVTNKITAQIGLVLVTIIWGLSFVLVKNALNDAQPFSFATLRFALSTILTLILINRNIFKVTQQEIIGGIICGFLLFLGYSFQNFGLISTTASKSAFITSVSILMVPILLVTFNMQNVKKRMSKTPILALQGIVKNSLNQLTSIPLFSVAQSRIGNHGKDICHEIQKNIRSCKHHGSCPDQRHIPQQNGINHQIS